MKENVGESEKECGSELERMWERVRENVGESERECWRE